MNVPKLRFSGVVMLFFALFLTGCKNLIWSENNIPDVKKLPSTLGVTLLADADINPNESLEPSPLSFQVIWMSEDSKLLATDVDQLNEKKLEDVLGKNYLDHQDFMLIPGQYKYLPPVDMGKDAKYIGVVAYFSQPNITQWKKVIKLSSVGHHYQILIHLHKDSVEIRKESED